MMWLTVILVVLVLGGVAAVAAGRFGHLPDVETELDRTGPGKGPLDVADAGHLRTVRFGLAFRGYRMDEVDALLDRLADQLEQSDAALERPALD